MRYCVIFNRRAAASSSEAAYWSEAAGWVPLSAAAVFAETSLPGAMPPGGIAMPAPPLRLDEGARADARSRFCVGDVVWVHDVASAAVALASAQSASLDGHYTYLGPVGDGSVAVAYPEGSRFTLPFDMLHPSPLNDAVALLRCQLGPAAKVVGEVVEDRGLMWVRCTIGGVPLDQPPPGWTVSASELGSVVLRSTSPIEIEWPLTLRPGDPVAWSVSAEVGAGLATVSEVRGDGGPKPWLLLHCGDGVEISVDAHRVWPTAHARRRHQVESALQRLLLAAERSVITVRCGVGVDDAAAGIERLVIAVGAGLRDGRVEALGAELSRLGYSVAATDDGFVAQALLDAGAPGCILGADGFEGAWGLTLSDRGDFFSLDEVEGCAERTVWSVIEANGDSVVLVPGRVSHEGVIGYVCSDRPWLTGAERVAWAVSRAPGTALAPRAGGPSM